MRRLLLLPPLLLLLLPPHRPAAHPAPSGACAAGSMDACGRSDVGGGWHWPDERDADSEGPWDCDGRVNKATGARCHEECESRHLDAVERSRFAREPGFRHPPSPSLVVAASRDMGRTASTWAFNAIRLLYRQEREACDSYWVRALSREKLQRRLATGAHIVVKTHEWTDQISRAEFEAVAPLFTHVVVSVREGFPRDPAWMEHATHTIHFEDVVAHDEAGEKIGALKVLRGLAEHLGIQGLSDADLRAVDHELMTMPMPSSGSDPVTKLWPFHARRGGRPQPPAPPEGASATAE